MNCHCRFFEYVVTVTQYCYMETLIGLFTAVLNFFSSIGKFFVDAKKPVHDFWNVETLFLALMLAVAVAGIGAFGPWVRKRKPDEFPWQ